MCSKNTKPITTYQNDFCSPDRLLRWRTFINCLENDGQQTITPLTNKVNQLENNVCMSDVPCKCKTQIEKMMSPLKYKEKAENLRDQTLNQQHRKNMGQLHDREDRTLQNGGIVIHVIHLCD